MKVEVVENPRRRRRRLSRAQLAAGFGGRRGMGGKKRSRKRYSNPALLASLGNPRRRRRSRSSYRVRHVVSHRNPALFGFDLGAAGWVAAGALGSTLVPQIVRKFWVGLPSTGPMNYLVRAGGTLATAYVAKMVTKNNRAFGLILAGGLGLIFVDLFRDYVAPNIPGLSGLAGDNSFVKASDFNDAYLPGVSGYVTAPGMSGYAGSDFNPAIMAA